MPDVTLTKRGESPQVGGGPQGQVFGSDSMQSPTKDTRGASEAIIETPVRYTDVTHQAARLAGRLNASAVTDAERDSLLTERAALLEKVIAGTISRSEQFRLDYVRWSLDRIEDAKHGPALDRLEAQVEEFKKLAEKLQGMSSNLQSASRKNRR